MTLLLATVAGAPGVAAQDTDEHPAIGAWMIDATPEDAMDPPELTLIAPGGIFINAFAEGTGYGSWTATGEQTADAIFLVPVNDPEAGFLGFFTVRASIEVAEDGQSFAGNYTLEYPAAMAEAMGMPVGQYGPGDVIGQRIAVEAMGEPVGPIPEEPVEPPAPDESLAPVESPSA
jgi:hypothetical protein